jgi:hypothetical protein
MKSTLKFALYGCCFLIGLALLNALSLQYPSYGDDLRLIEQNRPKLENSTILLIGASTTGNIKLKPYCPTSLSLHRGGSDFKSALAIARYALKQPNAIHTLIVTNTYGYLQMDNGFNQQDMEHGLYLALKEVGAEESYDISFSSAFIANYFPLIRQDRWSPPLKHLLTGAPYAPEMKIDAHGNHLEQRLGSFLSLEKDPKDSMRRTKTYLRDHFNRIESTFYYNSEITDKNIEHFKALVNLSRQHQIKLIVVVPPATDMYTAYAQKWFPHPLFPAELRQYLTDQHIPVLNYLEDPAYTQRYDLFFDSFHLNEDGIAKFSKHLFDDLTQQRIYCRNPNSAIQEQQLD